jgi:hypothetical protein
MWDVIELRTLNVNEAASSTAVNEGLCASLDQWSDNFPEVDSPTVVDFLRPHPLIPQQHQTD